MLFRLRSAATVPFSPSNECRCFAETVRTVSRCFVAFSLVLCAERSMAVSLDSALNAPRSLICVSVDQNVRIEIAYSTSSQVSSSALGSVESMAVIDPTVSERHQLVAKFVANDGQWRVLDAHDNTITAYVDLRYPGSSRKGERIGGTVLGALEMIQVDLDFTYRDWIDSGARLSAVVTYGKRNGEKLHQDFDCLEMFEDQSREWDSGPFAFPLS